MINGVCRKSFGAAMLGVGWGLGFTKMAGFSFSMMAGLRVGKLARIALLSPTGCRYQNRRRDAGRDKRNKCQYRRAKK